MFLLWQGKAFGYAVFAKTIGGSGNDFGSIYPTPDGGWIMNIQTNSFSGNYDIYLIKMDGNFNIQWRKRYYTSQDEMVSIQPTSDVDGNSYSEYDYAVVQQTFNADNCDQGITITWDFHYLTA